MKLIDVKKYYPNADYSPYMKQGNEIDKPLNSTIEIGMTMFNIKTKRLGLILGCIDEFFDGVVRLDSEGMTSIDQLRFATDKEIEENIQYMDSVLSQRKEAGFL